MVTESITVTKALAELKLLDKKIEKAINGCAFITVMQPKTSPVTPEEVTERITSDFQKVNDLIARRNAMKAALVTSNANTTLTIGRQTYTVAEAIDAKNTAMMWKKRILNAMANQANAANTSYTRMSADVENKAITLVKQAGEASTAEAAREMDLYKSYIKSNEIVFVDPLNVADLVTKLADEIDEFELNVDTQLAVTNAVTVLTFSYGSVDGDDKTE